MSDVEQGGDWLPFRCRVTAGRAISDPEKLVTPGVLYTSKRGPDLAVRLIAIGWWDWHISFLFAWRNSTPQECAQSEQPS